MSSHAAASRFHVELLTKLKQIKVFIWCNALDKPRIGCKLESDPKRLILVLFRDLTGSVEAIPIELLDSISVNLTTAQIIVREALITCTFQVQFEDDQSTYMWNMIHPTDQIISLSSIKKLSCANCGQCILKQPSVIEKVSILPTERWDDMREFWTCACTAHLFENRLPRSTVVRASPHAAQLASSNIQLHFEDLDTTTLMVDPEEPHTVAFHRNWKNIWCVRCGSLLGQAEMPNADSVHDYHAMNGTIVSQTVIEGPITEIKRISLESGKEVSPSEEQLDESINQVLFRNAKFDKHMIKTDTLTFEMHRLETKLSADILSIISISGCFKIVLRDYRIRKPLMLLTILGWDSLVFSSSAPQQPSRSTYQSLMPTIRLSYDNIGDEETVSSLSSTEILEFDAFRIFEISTLLSLRNSLLPPSTARLGTQTLSYLHYIPPMDASRVEAE
jgi:hypothetical protein